MSSAGRLVRVLLWMIELIPRHNPFQNMHEHIASKLEIIDDDLETLMCCTCSIHHSPHEGLLECGAIPMR